MSSRGLVVKAEDSWLRGRGFKPPLRRPFFRHHSFGAKIGWKLTWHCCICCNPAKGRVEFQDGWLIKSSFTTKGEMMTYENAENVVFQFSELNKYFFNSNLFNNYGLYAKYDLQFQLLLNLSNNFNLLSNWPGIRMIALA